MKGAVLVVDDDPELTRTVSQFLRKDDFAVTEAASARDALKELERRPYDFVVTDVKMPGMNGLEFCERVTSDYPDVPVFIVTALSTLPTAVEAIRVGAYDFITKPLNRDELLGALNRAAKKRQIQEYTREAPPETEDVQRSGPLKEIVGDSLMIETARRLVSQVGPLSSTILLQGEEGTGKALVARVAHDLSPRDANGRFIIVRCKNRDAAGLIEELFAPSTGTAKGRSKPRGAFARADGGTLYLAGVDSLPGEVQAQLVAYLDGERAAENEDHYPDVRLICSSEQKLEAIVEAGTFRSDLYLRISSITMTLPPLRDRGADILLIADRYLREISRRIGKRVSGLTQAAT